MDELASIVGGDQRFFVRHHIDSYNEFVREKLRETVVRMSPATVIDPKRCRIEVFPGGRDGDAIRLVWADDGVPPNLAELRLRNHSYTRNLVVDVTIEIEDFATGERETHTVTDVLVGAIPVMIGSDVCATLDREEGECRFDTGGYFIVGGKEKVIVAQERDVLNRAYVSFGKETHRTASVRCVSADSVSAAPRRVVVRQAIRDGPIHVEVPGFLDKGLPLAWIFRAIGVESDKQIVDAIFGVDSLSHSRAKSLEASLEEGSSVRSHRAALEHLSRHVRYSSVESAVVTLADALLPQAETDADKARLLGLIVAQMLEGPETDRDSYAHRRVATSGVIISEMFSRLFGAFFENMASFVDREYNIVYKGQYAFPFAASIVTRLNRRKIFDHSIVQDGFAALFKGSPEIQDLSRVSYASFLSHLRRLESTLNDKAKVLAPHRLHGSSFGFVCPSESPDGRNVGLVKNLALLARVSTRGLSTRKIVSEILPACTSFKDARANCFVLVNDIPAGFTDDKWALLGQLRTLLPADASVYMLPAGAGVGVSTDEGRLLRPLKAIEGSIVYLDAQAIDGSCLIAPFGKDLKVTHTYSHAELHPAAMLSVHTSTIPFANHNQSARNSFSSAQGKQSIGVFATNFRERFDVASYVLSYPQRPLVETQAAALVPASGVLNNGENLVVAIACFKGYNMEDSVIANKAAVERGMLSITAFKSVFAEEKTEVEEGDNGRTERRVIIGNPTSFFPEASESFASLDDHGLPLPESVVSQGDVIVGRVRCTDTFKFPRASDFGSRVKVDRQVDDASVTASVNETGIVDKVCASGTTVKVRLRKFRPPEIGDKVASRHGQKGVLGALMAQADMPRTRSGLVPDLIINPHAFPSRMTVGHLLECLAAKAALVSGMPVADGSAFEGADVDEIGRGLAERGFERRGEEIMYDGIGGQQMRATVFVGPTYYSRLKHMVSDKINARGRGQVLALTGQPTEGRANEGGIRIGEMERDAILGHGMAAFLKESYNERSDGDGKRYFLDESGNYTSVNVKADIVGGDNDVGRISAVNLPSAFHLFGMELDAMHVGTKLEVS